MASNFPGPYQVRVHYSCTPTSLIKLEHVFQLNCDLDPAPTPGDLFPTIGVKRRDTGTIDLDNAVDALVALLKPLFAATTTTFDYAELWKYEDASFISSYISSYDISETATGSGANWGAGQQIMTYRTIGGSTFRFTLQESELSPTHSQVYADMSTGWQALSNYFTDNANGVWIGRDNTFPFVFLKLHPGEDEYTFKRRFRA